MEVNKATSWEDVLANNFSTEQQQAEVETQEQKTEETTEVVDTNSEITESTDIVEGSENTESTQDDVSVEQDQGDVYVDEDDHSDYDLNEQQIEEPSFDELDEDQIFEILSLKKTDFNEVPDIDIVSGFIYDEHPNWDEEDVKFELEQKYGSYLFEEKIDLESINQEMDPDEYKEAVKYNKEIDRAQKLLRRDALEKRAELEQLQASIELPKLDRKVSNDDKSDVSSVDQAENELTQEEIEALQRQWIQAVENEVPSVSEFKFKLGDEEVSYKITEEEQVEMVSKMKEFNAETYLVQRGWVNQDGTPNVKKITEDVYVLENAEKMFKSGWTQAKEKAKMDIIGRDIKNIDLGSPKTSFDAKGGNPYDFGDYVLSL